jgi:hypothetical protein
LLHNGPFADERLSRTELQGGAAFVRRLPRRQKILLDRVSQQVSQAVTVVTNFTAGLKR